MSSRARKQLLLISGSTREGSVNTAALSSVKLLLPGSWTATTCPSIGLLPHFNPDVEATGPDPSVSRLRADIHHAAALLFSTPEYAGTMPGSLKNLLEWTIGSTVMTGKPVGWINPSNAPQRAAGAFASLESVLKYTGVSIVRSACRNIPVARSQINRTGTVDDKVILDQIIDVVRKLIASVESSNTDQAGVHRPDVVDR